MTLTVTIDKDSEDVIAQLLTDGRFSDANEVVRAGLRLVEERERARVEKLAWLRAEIQKGLDSGPAERFDPKTLAEEIKSRGREELARRKLAASNG